MLRSLNIRIHRIPINLMNFLFFFDVVSGFDGGYACWGIYFKEGSLRIFLEARTTWNFLLLSSMDRRATGVSSISIFSRDLNRDSYLYLPSLEDYWFGTAIYEPMEECSIYNTVSAS